ncbi:protein DDI1 homolog 1 [Suncus etruscus]|uniref:protein DDI1 homolog 1 n=1 Tax=Suncus etruscus TaxID=109475 RepID=UPI00211013E9|nr:protein DDI1 homolog 1 [Suncus etruscus]
MQVTVYCVLRDLSEVTFSLQLSSDFQLHDLRLLCELESGIPAAETQLFFQERPLKDEHGSLGSCGIKDGDVLVLLQKESPSPRPSGRVASLSRLDLGGVAVPSTSSARQQPPQRPSQHQRQQSVPSAFSLGSGEKMGLAQGMDNPALIRSLLLSSPHDLSLLKERNPTLADALLSGNLEAFTRVLRDQQQERAWREQERQRLYSADPFDLEAQARIEEEIRQQNIEENMTMAMEEAPESFGQVAMLYINCKVNGHALKAFVDSGAQMTIMNQACAERCNIMRLVDTRWAGIAKGVGTQRILGRVHLAQIQIEGDFLQCSFSILVEQPMDMLLGLDMLRRHQCSVDLKNNVLVIGTTGTQTRFLSEGELPACARLVTELGQEETTDREQANALKHSMKDPGRKRH